MICKRASSLITVLLFATAALIATSPASAIQCYTCLSCGEDPFSEARSTKENCASGVCGKHKVTNITASGTITSVTRTCLPISVKKPDCVTTDASAIFGYITTSCACTSNLCNSATSDSAPAILFIASTAAAVLLGL